MKEVKVVDVVLTRLASRDVSAFFFPVPVSSCVSVRLTLILLECIRRPVSFPEEKFILYCVYQEEAEGIPETRSLHLH